MGYYPTPLPGHTVRAMEFRLLGPLEVSGDGRMLSIGGPKQRIVLAHLLLRANEVVSDDRLIDAIGGHEPPETARNTLQAPCGSGTYHLPGRRGEAEGICQPVGE